MRGVFFGGGDRVRTGTRGRKHESFSSLNAVSSSQTSAY